MSTTTMPGITELEADLADLESAEDFFNYFDVAFDPAVLQVCRLHILQRFHDYMKHRVDTVQPGYEQYRACLVMAYEDFVRSDALSEKVFRVFKRAAGIATVPLSAIGRARY